MTSPDRFTTDKTYSPSTIHKLQQESKEAAALRAHADTKSRMDAAGGSFIGIILGGFANVAMAIGKALSDLAEALFGNYTGSNASLVVISDGMTGLNNRLDLMDDVSGYGGMIMSKNWRYNGGDTYKKVKFDTPYGPPKNVVYDGANHRIILAKGTWNVSLLLATSPINGAVWTRVRLDTYTPKGVLHTRKWLDWQSGPQNHTAFHQVPVICETDGYYVEAWFTHNGLWWTIFGGTERTLMYVNRWDVRTENNPNIPSPPDGGDVS